MNTQAKTHYRKVFKSDHLGVADLEEFQEAGSALTFTIDHVKQMINTPVAGKKIDANIAFFKESIKPLVLNATNSKTMSVLAGSVFVENWTDLTVKLYIDSSAKMKGSVVGGVRISTTKVAPVSVSVHADLLAMLSSQNRDIVKFLEWASKQTSRLISKIDDLTTPEAHSILQSLSNAK